MVALTGGIASGKSTVSRIFEDLGVPVVDTDVIAHQLVSKGTAILAKIRAHFGEDIVDETGELRRRKLRQIILADAKRRASLEEILHPAILRETLRQVKEFGNAAYCVVVIPLLAEIGVPDWVDRVLLVEASKATQLQRLQSRDSVTRREAELSLKAQASRESRSVIADDRITNVGAVGELESKVERLDRRFVQLANQTRIDSTHKRF